MAIDILRGCSEYKIFKAAALLWYDLKNEQEESVFQWKRYICVLPTGYSKSLCYEILAIE